MKLGASIVEPHFSLLSSLLLFTPLLSLTKIHAIPITPHHHLTTPPSQCTLYSYQCMEATPSLACANKCVFCWRHHKNPVGTEWRYVHPRTYEHLPRWLLAEEDVWHQSCTHSSWPFYLPSTFLPNYFHSPFFISNWNQLPLSYCYSYFSPSLPLSPSDGRLMTPTW